MGVEGEVTGVRRLSGGATRETWSFDLVAPGGPAAPGSPASAAAPAGLILRRGSITNPTAMGPLTECGLFGAAAAQGVPVPGVRFILDEADGMGNGFVMERVEGETIPRKILRDEAFAAARPRLAAECGEILARIHAADVSGVDSLPRCQANRHPALEQIDQYYGLLDAFGEPHPAFELGLKWLRENVPASWRVTLVHGDFRNGNLIVGPDGIRAVLDWELAHTGDPMEDLGWLCVKSWRFGVNDKVVGGFGGLGELLDAYEAAGGSADLETIAYWELFGTLKWGVMCILQTFTHINGVHRSVELAALGRRVCEMEHDVLELLPW